MIYDLSRIIENQDYPNKLYDKIIDELKIINEIMKKLI
jgi:hypothetical protein